MPDYWDLEKDSWPINILNKIAEAPQINSIWYSPGDTVSIKKNKSIRDLNIIDKNGKTYEHFIITEPILLKDLLKEDSQEQSFRFLCAFPIFKTELDYKLRNSATILIRRFLKKGVDEKINLYRTYCCRRRFLGLF